MANQSKQQDKQEGRVGLRDIWELILKLILILIFIAWFIAEYIAGQELDIITILVLLIILAGLVGLILRQKHFILLQCQLLDPGGCVRGDDTILSGRVLEPVIGDATGWGFSHYLLELRDPAGVLITDSVIYPDGSGNPDVSATQGNYAKSGSTLGWIDVEKAVTSAGIALLTSTTFEITLRVFGVDASEKSPPCKITFDVSVNEVYIKQISEAWSDDFANESEPLRRYEDATSELVAVGGTMHVRGAANIYGCTGEKIAEYSIWAKNDPSFSIMQPATFSTFDATGWIPVTHIKFEPQTIGSNSFTADQVREYNVLDGDPDPHVLTNKWGVRNEIRNITVDLIQIPIIVKLPDLKEDILNSKSKLGTGKFTFLLQVIDTAGNTYYDIQRAWVDNENVVAVIDGIENLADCADLYTKNKSGAFKTVTIRGTAWDPLIVPTDPITTAPNDNFHYFKVSFQKQGAAGVVELIDSSTPIPARPAPVGIGDLVDWDLSMVDKTSAPSTIPADQLLEEGEECTYDIILHVRDKTIFNEHDVHRSGKITYPIKIINSSEP
jgi:hypothetical protein